MLARLFVTSVLVYMAAAYLIQISSQGPRLEWFAPESNLLRQIFYAAALLLGIGVIVGRRFFFKQSRLRRLVEERGLRGLVDELATKTILLVAVSEAIAVLGLILSILTRSAEPMVRLGLIGIVLLLYNMPRRSAWERTVENFKSIAYEE